MLVDEHGMEQCRAEPCEYRKILEGVMELILVVHVDDILVSGEKEACDELHHTLNDKFPTKNLGELKWYLGCALERDWQQGSAVIKQPAMILQIFHATQRVRNHFDAGQRGGQGNDGEPP